MRYLTRGILPGVLGFAVAVLVAACGGGSGLFSAGQATNLDDQLNTISAAISGGQCSAASSAAQDFDNAVSNLNGVNASLVNNLKNASQQLAQKAQSDCQAQQSSTTTKTKTQATATRTHSTPTPTQTTGTQSTPAETTGTTSTQPTTPTQPGSSTSGGAGLTGGTDTSGTPATGGAGPGGAGPAGGGAAPGAGAGGGNAQ